MRLRFARRRLRYWKDDPLETADADEFRRDYRMKKDTFAELLHLVKEQLSPADATGDPTPPHLKLLVALRFYAIGSYHYATGKMQGFSPSHVCQIVKEVSAVLSSHLPSFVTMPTPAQVVQVSVALMRSACE